MHSGSLPYGLSLSSSGIISGTPITSGFNYFMVKATNSVSSTTKSFSINIKSSIHNYPVIESYEYLSSYAVGTHTIYEEALYATGATPMTWSIVSGSLPDGFEMYDDGFIYGTTWDIGTYYFTAEVTNSYGSASKDFIIEVY